MKLLRIGACLKAESNPFWSVDMRKGLEEGAKTFGDIQLFYQSPERIDDVVGQKRIVRDFIKKGVDAILLAPSDPIRLATTVTSINKAKIPLVIVDSHLDDREVVKRKLHFSFLGFDDYKGGFETGKIFVQHFSKGTHVAIIQGYKIGSYTKRVDGFRDAMGSHLNLKAVVSGNFEEEKAYQETKKLLKKFQDLKAIFCTSDNMAMGALTALFEMNRNEVIVSGFDATHAGKLALQKGRLLSTVSTDPEEMGRKAIKMARDMALGLKSPSEHHVEIQLLTKERLLAVPKQVFQKRRYPIVYPDPALKEFDYSTLHRALDCPIILGKDFLTDVPPRLRQIQADKYLVITDEVVHRLYGEKFVSAMQQEGLRTELFTIPAGEQHKTFTALNDLATRILVSGMTKKSCLVLLGGGVVGNLAGFLAAILMRGIRFVHIPTTTIAQIDSTTGGKQAVNTEHGKNLLGTYYEPEFVYIDFNFVKTLPAREFRSGIAEAIKHGLCQSQNLLSIIEKNDYQQIVSETIRLKTHLIEADPREQGAGLVLLYGHTIGHALETVSNHRLNHGEAISIGMMAAARLSNAMGFCKTELVARHEKILERQGLPIRIPQTLKVEDILRVLSYDKKERAGRVPFILLEDIESMKKDHGNYLIPVKEDLIRKVLGKM